MEPRRFISHYQIFDYWKDKAITESGDVVIDFGYEGCNENELDPKFSIPVVNDWGEPECWACGNYIPGYDYGFVDECGENLKKVYEHDKVKSFFEKAHIYPHALGGTEDPENMFLLCHECHRESPDTKYPREFYRWVYTRRKKGHRAVEDCFNLVNELTKRNIPAIFMDASPEQVSKAIASHGGLIMPTSIAAAILGDAEDKWEKFKSFLLTLIDNEKVLEIQSILVSHYQKATESILSDPTNYYEYTMKEKKAYENSSN